MSGKTVGLMGAWAIPAFDRPDVVFVPVTDLEPVVTALAWAPSRLNGLVARFVQAARDALPQFDRDAAP